jgi:hypothetical protein
MSHAKHWCRCGCAMAMHESDGGPCCLCECQRFTREVAINTKTAAEQRAEIRLLKEQLAAKKAAQC